MICSVTCFCSSALLYSPAPWLLPASGTLQERLHVQHQFTVNTSSREHHTIHVKSVISPSSPTGPAEHCAGGSRAKSFNSYREESEWVSWNKHAELLKRRTLHNEGSVMALCSFITMVKARWNQQIECVFIVPEGSSGRGAGTQTEVHRHVRLRSLL